MKKINKVLALLMAVIMVFTINFSTPVKAAGSTITKIVVRNSETDSPKIVNVAKGKTIKIHAIVTANPNIKANKKVKFKSANPKIASVDNEGVITGIKPGKTKIIVTSVKDPKKKATINVTVKANPVFFVKILMPESTTVYTGSTLQLKSEVIGKNNSYKKVRWYSNDKSVATVSQNGLVTAKKAGKVNISVRAVDGSELFHEIELEVKDKE